MPKPKKSDPAAGAPKKDQTRNQTQFSVTFAPQNLAELDRYVEIAGVSRSVFLWMAAQKEIARMKKSEGAT
jgi:hypothetical protein